MQNFGYMKKILFVFITCMVLMSCSKQAITRRYGGNMTVNLKPGERLIEATWKENSVWYLVEPMDSDYKPKTKVFKENSALGIVEGSITFVETR